MNALLRGYASKSTPYMRLLASNSWVKASQPGHIEPKYRDGGARTLDKAVEHDELYRCDSI